MLLSFFDKARYPWTFDRRQAEIDQSAEINVRYGLRKHGGDAGIAQRPGRILCARAHAEIDPGNYEIPGLYLYVKLRINAGHYTFDVSGVDTVAEFPYSCR